MRLLLIAALACFPASGRADPSPADRAVAAAEARLARDGGPDAHVALAAAFMRKARESGDPSYYGRARAAVERARALDPSHYGALRATAWVLLGLHDFRGALAAAEAARAREPDDWWNDADIADADVELGDYAGAVQAAQRMLDRRPGLPSYARAAFLRSLHGDRTGAIALLELAADAADPKDPEALAWVLVHLGGERFAGGELPAAASADERALAVLPEYHLALAGLARVRTAEGRLSEAIALYRRAVARVPLPDVVAALGDALAAVGDEAGAEQEWALVEYEGRVAEAAGTTFGRQLALFLADHERRPDAALRLARAEAAMRDDVYTDDALAWALHANGRDVDAARSAHRALRLGTDDPLLHWHAGAIAAALGRTRPAARHLRRALALNPRFDLRQAPRARAVLATLDSPAAVASAR
jgi:tetratricopeptide (TPR) repeat protein